MTSDRVLDHTIDVNIVEVGNNLCWEMHVTHPIVVPYCIPGDPHALLHLIWKRDLDSGATLFLFYLFRNYGSYPSLRRCSVKELEYV